jgi:hypothetical protein
MAHGGAGRSFAVMNTRSPIPLTLAALMAADLAGIIVGVHDRFASVGGALVNGTYTNAPLPIYALQIAGVALLLAGRGAGHVALQAAITSLTDPLGPHRRPPHAAAAAGRAARPGVSARSARGRRSRGSAARPRR